MLTRLIVVIILQSVQISNHSVVHLQLIQWCLPIIPLLKKILLECKFATKNGIYSGRLGGQSVKCPTLDFGSGHDLTVCGIEPMSGSVLTMQSLLGSLSPFLSALALLIFSLSLSQNKEININKNKYFQEGIISMQAS